MRRLDKLAIAGLAAIASVAGAVGAAAQERPIPQITVTPFGPGGTGYYGAYGRSLPGVYMLTNSGLPVTPSINRGQVKLPGDDVIADRYTYNGPLPFLDAWHGTIGPGFPF